MENLKYYCNHHPNVVSLMLYGMNVLLMYLMSLWIVHTPAIYQSQTNMYLLQAFQVTVVLFLAFVLAKLDGKRASVRRRKYSRWESCPVRPSQSLVSSPWSGNGNVII